MDDGFGAGSCRGHLCRAHLLFGLESRRDGGSRIELEA
jgi:hypothetical protein